MKHFVVAAVAALATAAVQHSPPPPRAHLVIVVDGLRPGDVSPDVMPRLARLGQRGIVFNAHHSAFPTVTRVNASSLVTGAYPDGHGLLGNHIYIPRVRSTAALDTAERANLEAVARVEGRLLTVPSLGEILLRAGRRLLVVGAGSSGNVFLLNHAAPSEPVIHQDFTRPAALATRLRDVLGPMPHQGAPTAVHNQRAIDAYLKIGLDEIRPEVTLLWLAEPDSTAHASGVGSPLTRKALALVDRNIGQIEDGLQAKGLRDRTNIIVTSDHGFSTHTGTLKLDALVDPFSRRMPDGSRDIVVSQGAIYLRRSDPTRVAAIVAALQRRPEVGAIFTRAPSGGGPNGVVPGTLSFNVVRWNHSRSGDILVSANWTHDRSEAGVEGKTTATGVAGHGSSSPYDIHNTLIAAGPDFREHAVSNVPTGIVDLAPTLLRLLGLNAEPTMSGRIIVEGLRGGGPAPADVPVDHSTRTVKTNDGRYELTAHFSSVGGHDYLDFTTVTRR
jgi:predicted AlkP superfamily pyrophosphatase or phosphodiesterase